MAERVTLTTPETKPNNTGYQITSLLLDVAGARIMIQLAGDNGESKTVIYSSSTTPTAQTLMTGLNKANLTTRSLNQRIFDRLITDGHLVGAVAGTVD